ncbi:transmembrane protein 126A-like [Asterias rubens]|uniref:transmembrane protein 126A-like n=1 Tax=Asterias rubens TaxID=7604 RepID=UPI0014554FA0|nr:transmembrane protein 126A-like [Asterias rubens]XP_033637515.1 transmembrane protein 126A-like [Asterias rubens]XP_033637516.1 transmembrane protein 126A-like [Asterias rubens]
MANRMPSIIQDAATMTTKSTSNSEQEFQLISPDEAMKMQMEQIQELPSGKRWPFDMGPLMLSVNAGLVGVISNSFFRRMLMVRKGLFLTSLPMAIMPALIMTPAWSELISKPILLGNMKCEICADIRGGLINFALGAVYPFFLAGPLSAALAKRYDTVKIPKLSLKKSDQRTLFNFWSGKVRYFKTQFIAITIFQTCFGMYVAGSQIALMRNGLKKKLEKL